MFWARRELAYQNIHFTFGCNFSCFSQLSHSETETHTHIFELSDAEERAHRRQQLKMYWEGESCDFDIGMLHCTVGSLYGSSYSGTYCYAKDIS